jgi:hypothetical protein
MFGGKASADQRKGPHAPSPSQGSNSTRRSNDTLRARLRRTTRQDNARRQGSPNGSCHRIRAQHGGRRERNPLRVRGSTDNRGLGLSTSAPLFTQLCRVLLRRSSQYSASRHSGEAFSTVQHPPKLGHIGQPVNARGFAYATCCALQPHVARQFRGTRLWDSLLLT